MAEPEQKTVDFDDRDNYHELLHQKYLAYIAAGDLETVKRIVLLENFEKYLQKKMHDYALACLRERWQKNELQNPCGYCIAAELLSRARDPSSKRFSDLCELFNYVCTFERKLMVWAFRANIWLTMFEKHCAIKIAVELDNPDALKNIFQTLQSFEKKGSDEKFVEDYSLNKKKELFDAKSREVAQILINANWLPSLPYGEGTTAFNLVDKETFVVCVNRAWGKPIDWIVLGKKTKLEPGKKIKTD